MAGRTVRRSRVRTPASPYGMPYAAHAIGGAGHPGTKSGMATQSTGISRGTMYPRPESPNQPAQDEKVIDRRRILIERKHFPKDQAPRLFSQHLGNIRHCGTYKAYVIFMTFHTQWGSREMGSRSLRGGHEMPRIRNLLLGVAVGAAVSTGAAGIATLTTATAANASPLPQSSHGWHGPHWGCWGWHTLHAAKK